MHMLTHKLYYLSLYYNRRYIENTKNSRIETEKTKDMSN